MAKIVTMDEIINNNIYIGVFTPKLKVSGKLTNEVKDPHITLKFRPNEDEIKRVLNSEQKTVEIFFTGYGISSKNEGLGVYIPEPLILYEEIKNPHITISWSEDSTPVRTGELVFDQEVPDFYQEQMEETYRDDMYGESSINGRIGFFQKGGKIIFLDELIQEEEFFGEKGLYTKQNLFEETKYFLKKEYFDDWEVIEITKADYESAKENAEKNKNKKEVEEEENSEAFNFCFTTWNGKKDYITVVSKTEEAAKKEAWKQHANFTKGWKDPTAYLCSEIELL